MCFSIFRRSALRRDASSRRCCLPAAHAAQAAGRSQSHVTVAPPPAAAADHTRRGRAHRARHAAGLRSSRRMTQGPVGAMLAYADKVRQLGPARTRDRARPPRRPQSIRPPRRCRLAIVLAQTRAPADLAKAHGLLQRVIANPSADALPLQPLARVLAARYWSSAGSKMTATSRHSRCATASAASTSSTIASKRCAPSSAALRVRNPPAAPVPANNPKPAP